MLGGPLEDSDPGCGVAELNAVLDRFPNLQNLGGSVYADLAAADGTEDPYTLVDSRHLPPVKLYDLQVIKDMVKHVVVGTVKLIPLKV